MAFRSKLIKRYYQFRKVALDPLAWVLSKRELIRLMNHSKTDIEKLYDAQRTFVGRGFYSSIRATQSENEFKSLARMVQSLSPETIVEIGSYKGGTLFMWCRVAPSVKLAISIDLPHGPFGGGYDAKRKKLYEQFLWGRERARLHLIRSDSHNPETVSRVKRILGSNKIDFLFIDGDHTYNGVKRDFELYWPLVRSGGIAAFHDIITEGGGHEVYKYWNEVKKKYKQVTTELIDRPESKKFGIGVIVKP